MARKGYVLLDTSTEETLNHMAKVLIESNTSTQFHIGFFYHFISGIQNSLLREVNFHHIQELAISYTKAKVKKFCQNGQFTRAHFLLLV